jgi:cytochrome c-type biogenesis protein CcmH/NrfG
MKSPIRPLIIALLLVPGVAASIPGLAADSGPPPARDPVREQVSAATQRQDWPAAQAALRDALAKDPGNADYHNLYAYSIRKGANPDMNLVFKHYNEALRLDPKHRGAHEYIGEAYLMVGNLPKAKEHLGQLDKLCFLPCSEFSDLKNAIAAHERKQVAR